MATVLETRDLKKHYRMGAATVRALDGVSLTVEQGEFVGLLETSGSGKSTLANLITMGKAKEIPTETPVGVLNTAGQMFAVARAVLEGRIAAAGGDKARAIGQFRIAAAAEDLLAYDEPPTWYYPVRETLGAALLASGDAAAAGQVFKDDLTYNPGTDDPSSDCGRRSRPRGRNPRPPAPRRSSGGCGRPPT